MKIDENVIEKVSKMLLGHMTDYVDEIDMAYENNKELTISLKIKLSPGDRQPLKIRTSMSFPTGKVSAESDVELDPGQLALFADIKKGNIGIEIVKEG